MMDHARHERIALSRVASWALALLLLALGACGTEESSLGTLSLGLTGSSPAGTTYRLRQGELALDGAEADLALSTEEDPTRTRITVRAPGGAYSLSLADGWYLERVPAMGAATRVEATLLSANPQPVTITPGQLTSAVLRFRAGDDVVAIGDGDLEVVIDIEDPAPEGLGPWTGSDDVPPSAEPPFGLAPGEAPMFVALGFDDNGASEGIHWALDTLATRVNPDGTPATATFFNVGTYGGDWIAESPVLIKRAWNRAYQLGHEVGNHSYLHGNNPGWDQARWTSEIQLCQGVLTRPFDPNEPTSSPSASTGAGVALADILGFRAPFMAPTQASMAAVKALGFRYDASVEEGFQADQDGTNYLWPYTLDQGSPGHELFVGLGSREPIGVHPGLWELPVHAVIAPPNDAAAQYGIPAGFRERLRTRQSWFDTSSGKLTGYDYQLWVSFQMTKAEFLATLKYTLDRRLAGNRAPLFVGLHSDYYATRWNAQTAATLQARREAIAEFLDYALSKPEVRIKSHREVLDWVRNPSPL